ncbi:hypothetical protein [Planosporangium thailandense]|nr:hypothetical protein [Planosporangium thailandense]
MLPAATVPMALLLGPPLTYRVPTDGEECPASPRRIFPARPSPSK